MSQGGIINVDGTSNAVSGPGSSTDNDIVVFSGTTGKVIKDTGISSISPTFTGTVTTLNRFVLPFATAAGEGIYLSNGQNLARAPGNAQSNFFFGNAGNSTMTGISNTGVGESALAGVTTGNQNTAMGNHSLQALTSSDANTALGYASASNLTNGVNNCAFGWGSLNVGNTYSDCTAIGTQSLNQCLGNNNTAIGSSAGIAITSGINNTTVGRSSLNIINTGSYNTAIGFAAGTSYTTSDSSNIAIMNSGTSGESNVIRIGTEGSGSGQQNKCFLAGVLNTVSGRVVKLTTPGAYPYTTLITDYLILVDTTSARTIIPLANPVTGTTYRIKDNVGSAGTNNITVTPSGKNIDGAASFVISSNYGAIDIVYNGTQWNIL